METVEISRSRPELPLLPDLLVQRFARSSFPVGDLCSCRVRLPRPLKWKCGPSLRNGHAPDARARPDPPPGCVTLISRNGRDHTKQFPEPVNALQRVGGGAVILDWEVPIYDQTLISRFEWLRHRSPPDMATPPLFMVFDCLSARGKDLREHRLSVRRNILEDMLAGQDVLLPVRRLADDGLTARQEVLERGYEGLVAKDPQAPYIGGRTLKWLKVKQPKYRERERGWEPKRSGP